MIGQESEWPRKDNTFARERFSFDFRTASSKMSGILESVSHLLG
jgi:hypothetical protein